MPKRIHLQTLVNLFFFRHIANKTIIPAKKLYRVQVGAFASRDNAEKYADMVRKAGFGAVVVEDWML